MENRSRTLVQKLLSEIDAQKDEIASYTIYLPNEIKKTTTRREKEVINHVVHNIAFSDVWGNIDQNIIDLLAHNEISKFNLLFEFIKQIQDLFNKAEGDHINTLANYLTEKFPAFYKSIEAAKTSGLPLSLMSLTRELIIWLESAHFHAYLKKEREEVAILFSDKSPEKKEYVLHPIKERGELRITVAMKDIIFKIGKMDAKESLPPIISILQDMKRNVDPAKQESFEALEYAIRILNQADIMQHKDFKKAVTEAFKSGLLGKMNAELIELVKQLKKLQLEPNLIDLCKELALWLESLYFHTYNRKGIDWEDTFLKTTTAFRYDKLKLASYYHEAALVIEEHLKAYFAMKKKDSIPVKPPKDKIEKQSPLTVPANKDSKSLTNEDKKANQTKAEPFKPLIFATTGPILPLVITNPLMQVREIKSLPQSPELNPSSPPAAQEQKRKVSPLKMNDKPNTTDIVTDLNFFVMDFAANTDNKNKKSFLPKIELEKIQTNKSESKFSRLKGFMDEYDLSPSQIKAMQHLKPAILATLEADINQAARTTYSYLPTALFPRKHVPSVKAAKEAITWSDGPKQDIITLYNLWLKVKPDGEGNSSKQVIILLDSIVETLHNACEPEEENTKSVNAISNK